jgi:hypothetical protein
MTIIIKRSDGSADILTNVPDDKCATDVVYNCLKKTIHFQVHGTIPAVIWWVAKSNNFVDAMIESSLL